MELDVSDMNDSNGTKTQMMKEENIKYDMFSTNKAYAEVRPWKRILAIQLLHHIGRQTNVDIEYFQYQNQGIEFV